jgi:hypothetical protein
MNGDSAEGRSTERSTGSRCHPTRSRPAVSPDIGGTPWHAADARLLRSTSVEMSARRCNALAGGALVEGAGAAVSDYAGLHRAGSHHAEIAAGWAATRSRLAGSTTSPVTVSTGSSTQPDLARPALSVTRDRSDRGRDLETAPPDAAHWSTRGLAAEHGISYTTVRGIWRAFGLKPWRTDEFQASRCRPGRRIRDIVALYTVQPGSFGGRSTETSRDRPQDLMAADSRREPTSLERDDRRRACAPRVPIPRRCERLRRRRARRGRLPAGARARRPAPCRCWQE